MSFDRFYNINRDPDYCDGSGIQNRVDVDFQSSECCGEYPFRRSYRENFQSCGHF